MNARWSKSLAVTLSLAATTLGLTACGGGTSSSSDAASSTLTIAMSGDTLSLDPTTCAPPVYCFAAYDALIHMNADGSYEPDLAKSWEFTDDSHQSLRVELRTDAKFTDGTPLNAQAVVASLTRFLETPGPNRSNATPVEAVKEVGENAVEISYTTPVTIDYASFQLTEQNGFGVITSVAGATDPGSLAEQTQGIGPYKLDPSETQKGSQYTFVPNADYFNQDAITYKKIVLKPIPNPASRLSAIQSGQVQWAHALPPNLAESAQDAGLNLSKGSNGSSTVLVLGDRTAGPLSDDRVREAISLAVPREEMAASIFAGYATATASLVPEGLQGYDEASAGQVDVDLERARQLMADAGYSEGFELDVYDPTFFDPNNAVGQALVDPLAEIGITVKLTADDSEPGQVVQTMFSKTHSAVVFSKQGSSTYGTVRIDLSPGGYLNPFGTPMDPALEAAVTAAAQAGTPEDQAELEQKATVIMDALHWAIPIVAQTSVQATTDEVDGVPDQFVTRELNPFGPVTDGVWAPLGG